MERYPFRQENIKPIQVWLPKADYLQLPEDVGIDSERLNAIERWLRRYSPKGLSAVKYCGKDGVVIYDRSFGSFEYGVSSKVTDETVYDLASITKQVLLCPQS